MKKIPNAEVYNPYKQLQNDGFEFYNFKSNDIAGYYTVRLTDADRIISRKLMWGNQKYIYKAHYRDMNAVHYRDMNAVM